MPPRSTTTASPTAPHPQSKLLSAGDDLQRQLVGQDPVSAPGGDGDQHEGAELGQVEEDRGGEAGRGENSESRPQLPHSLGAGRKERCVSVDGDNSKKRNVEDNDNDRSQQH